MRAGPPGAPSPPPDRGPAPGLRARGVSWHVLAGTSLASGHAVWLEVVPAACELAFPGAVRGLEVQETGNVPVARVKNPEGTAVLLTGQRVVRGGLQTRVFERTVVVPPYSDLEVPVRCVEAGRWAPRDDAPSSFAVGAPVSTSMKRRITQGKRDSMRVTGDWSVDQRAVWREVDAELSRASIPSRTRSYEAYLDGVQKQQIDALARAPIRVPERANGVLLRPRRGGFWLEIFPGRGALVEQVESLLADLAVPDPEPWSSAGAVPKVDELLDRLWTAPLHRVESIPGALGETFALDAGDASGEVVMVTARVAHVAIGAAVP